MANIQNNIIPLTAKQNPGFNTHLAALARSDAHHDLKKEFTYKMYSDNNNIKTAFDSGIPMPANTVYHEADALAASIIRAVDPGGESESIEITGEETKLKAALAAVPDCTNNASAGFHIFDVGFNNNPIFKYRVVKFVIMCSNNKASKPPVQPYSGPNFGQTFVTNTQLGKQPEGVALIVDFSQHHFMQSLVMGEYYDFNIHYLMTPEVVNDPAGKPNIHNPSLFGKNVGGVNLISYIQSGDSKISYTSYNPIDPSPANNFFSNYNFTLSPIEQTFIKGKAENLIAVLDIDYDDKGTKANPKGDAPPLTDNIPDSKGENSVSTVLGYLKDVIKKINKWGRGTFDRADAFSFNSKCQQKRGGDWFQVLSCLDVKNRNFTQILPNLATGDDADKPIPKCPVYLVTHDQIAVSYALLNGVNVIYIDYFGTIYVFKNTADTTIDTSGKPMEQILFDGLKTQWNAQNPKTRTFKIVELLTTGEQYTLARTKYLEGIKTAFKDTTCAEIKNVLQSLETNDNIGTIQKEMTSGMSKLFTEAVKLMFAQINLIDINDAVVFVKANRNILNNPNYDAINDASKNSKINNLSKYINNIQSIQNRFGKISAIEVVAETHELFKNWVDATVVKLDIYKTANNILSGAVGTEQKTFVLSRLVNFFTGSDIAERKTDSHIFLPFIQSLDIDSRKEITEVLKAAVAVTTNYDALINNGTQRSFRGGKISPNQLYLNKLGNLIQEALIFVITDEAKYDTEIIDIVGESPTKIDSFVSTDALLLQTDWDELAIFLGDTGKSSNYATETEDQYQGQDLTLKPDIQSGGTFMSYYGAQKNRTKITPAFCNVSVKQITWPLITSLLIIKPTWYDYFAKKVESFVRPAKSSYEIKTMHEYLEAQTDLIRRGRHELENISDEAVIQEEKSEQQTKNLAILGTGAVILGAPLLLDIASSYAGYPINVSDDAYTAINTIAVLAATVANEYNIIPYSPFGQVEATNVDEEARDDTEEINMEDHDEEVEADNLYAPAPVTSSRMTLRSDSARNPFNIPRMKLGGAIDDDSSPVPNENLMVDNNLGFHPLVPIYGVLTAYYNTLGNKSTDDPFFYTYFTYINVLEKMKKVIEEKYLDDVNNPSKSIAAYLIGFGINIMLFTSNTSMLQTKQILDVIGMSQQDYFEFSLKNDSFAGLFSGAIHQDIDEEVIGMSLVNNELFRNFINNEVNIKEILQQGTPVENLPNYEVLKDRIFKIMSEIVVKVNADRGTPITEQGIVTPTAEQGVASGIPGISSAERASRAAIQQQKFEENKNLGITTPTSQFKPFDTENIRTGKDLFTYSTGSDENIVKSTTSSSSRSGGKKSRRNKQKKKKVTRKQRKSYKNTTKKVHKKHKKTRKH